MDHPQGQGNLISKACEVEFHMIVPENICNTPYFLVTSCGIHTHPPPPPNKAPKKVVEEIIQLIQRIRGPELTLGL